MRSKTSPNTYVSRDESCGKFTRLYVVKLLFGEAVDGRENLLIYSTKPAILETNENERLIAGEIINARMPLKEQLNSPP